MIKKIIIGFYVFSLLGIVSCKSNVSPDSNVAQQDSMNKLQQEEDSLDAEAMHDLAPAVGILPK